MAFNSNEYGWSNIRVVMLGKDVAGIRGIKYKVSKEKEFVYARGNEPHSISSGNKSYEGSVTLKQSEVEALERAAGAGNDLTDLQPFDITVAYVPVGGSKIQVDIIQGVELEDYEKGMSQGDKFAEIEIPFKALRIKRGQ